MNAYPLIYSRTKNDDFAPQFLTRPSDMTQEEVREALRYVGNAISNLDTFQEVRYSTFSVGNFCICGGISCISKNITEQLHQQGEISETEFQALQEYLKDCKGRKIAFFVGFAIHKNDVRSGKIPNITLVDYWKIYLEYLKHQWDEATTTAELVSEPIEIPEKTYSSLHAPKTEKINGKTVIVDFDEKKQETLEYYFNQILNQKLSVSFVSEVRLKSEWDSFRFTDYALSEGLYHSLKTPAISKTETEEMGSIMGNVGIARTQRSPSISDTNGTFQNTQGMVKKTAPPPVSDTSSPETDKKKEEYSNKSANSSGKLPILLGIVLVVIILIILIVISSLKK